MDHSGLDVWAIGRMGEMARWGPQSPVLRALQGNPPAAAAFCLTRPAQAIYMNSRVIYRGGVVLANHLTPNELANEVDMKRQEVIARCVQMGVPIFHGKIDKTLFVSSLKQLSTSSPRTV
jgi:hypothetical protein